MPLASAYCEFDQVRTRLYAFRSLRVGVPVAALKRPTVVTPDSASKAVWSWLGGPLLSA